MNRTSYVSLNDWNLRKLNWKRNLL